MAAGISWPLLRGVKRAECHTLQMPIASAALAAVCVSSTLRSLPFILLGLMLEKKCSRRVDVALRAYKGISSSLAHLAGIPIHRGAAENWGSSLQKLPGAIYGAVPAPPSSQRQQCKFQANYLTIATLSAMTAQRTVQQRKLFAPPLYFCSANFYR
jgi:hypothetical protein